MDGEERWHKCLDAIEERDGAHGCNRGGVGYEGGNCLDGKGLGRASVGRVEFSDRGEKGP